MAKSKNAVCGVYAWEVNGIYRYVGSARDIYNSRKSNHKDQFKKGEHIPKLQQLWDEYGEEAFKLVEIEKCLVQDLFKREDYHKKLHKDTIYNINDIQNYNKSVKKGIKAKNHKQKLRELNSGENNPRCVENMETIINIKCCIRDGMRNKDIAKLFNKRPEYISQIKIGYRWPEIEIPYGYEFYPYKENEIAATAMDAIPTDGDIFYIPIMPQPEPVQTPVIV